MLAWPSPHVPALPGTGLPLRLHDTAARGLVTTAPAEQARLYVCGITPYDATHLGHAATYVAFDLVQRAWRDAGHSVRYVQNVTDVDDPLLERATATGVDWTELAQEQTALFREDMTALGVLAPAAYVGAVEAVPLVVEAVEKLLADGHAYRVDGEHGDVYFPVHDDPRFGEVSHLDQAAMLEVFAERGGDPARAGKRHPLDCLLWQAERPGEPAWDSSLGRGRPGWHLECTAIALEHLGGGFDVQGGGSDLAFPHHEMGASEAHVLTGEHPWAKAYVHTGMVGYQGHKMSKSRGNLVLVSRLRAEGTDPAAVRLALLAHHYRSDWEYRDSDVERATARLAAWRAALGRPTGPEAMPLLAELRDRLAEDLDAPGALAAVDRWVEASDAGADDGGQGAPGLVSRAVDALLGVRL